MITVELRFLANRYHGTGWGRHVNEGVAEWPPSPYRLIRALYDVWKRKAPHLADTDVELLFRKLASDLPVFYGAEKVVPAHTRSYLNSNTLDPTDKSLIFDAFVSLAPGQPCWIQWNVELDKRLKELFAELLGGLNYLGRSESWVEAGVVDGPGSDHPTCWPSQRSTGTGSLVYLACPIHPHSYHGKQGWLDALGYSTTELYQEKLSGPPAMLSAPYVVREGVLTNWLPSLSNEIDSRISGAVLELTGRVLPRITEAVRVAERIRGRIMRHFEARFGTGAKEHISSLIHGKGEDGFPLKDHSHLFILPQANPTGFIDRIFVYARDRTGKPTLFNHDELAAIINIDYLHWMSGARAGKQHPVRVTTAWTGSHDDPAFRPKSKRVRSSTPFVTIRHWRKGRGTMNDFLKDEVRRECRNHGIIPEVTEITCVQKLGLYLPQQFRRAREGEASRPGFAFEIEFAEAVSVPFSLGYASHFGLGQFTAV
jgi:CRISPR-associated protein Csb2